MIFVVNTNPAEFASKKHLKNVWAVLKDKSPERFKSLGCYAQTFFILNPRNMEFATSYCDEGSSVDQVEKLWNLKELNDLL
jgi:hypothetical protein